MGTTSFDSGRDALKAVAESLGAWNWVFFRATGDVVAVEDLSVVAGGIGSVEEMQSCYEEHPQDAEWMTWWYFFGGMGWDDAEDDEDEDEDDDDDEYVFLDYTLLMSFFQCHILG